MQDVADERVPNPVKTERVCWGCNDAEPKGVRFNQCPRCTKERFIPALFCSQKCFKEAWSRHKKWHEEEGPQWKKRLSVWDWSSEDANDCTYNAYIAAAKSKMRTGDMKGAKRVLQMAIKEDASQPEAFYNLAPCYGISHQKSEACSCALEACKRFAMAALADFLNDKTTDTSRARKWVLCIITFTAAFMTLPRSEKLQKPTWWCHDGLLKRTVKVALAVSKDVEAGSLPLLAFAYACALSGLISQGEIPHQRDIPISIQTVAVNRTSEELKEASALFKIVAEADPETYASFVQRLNLSEVCTTEGLHPSLVERGTSVSPDCTPLEKGEAGLWVLIRGLESPSGLAMNGKIGLVCMGGLKEGHVAVKVDGIIGPKRIRPKNLCEVPFPEWCLVLIQCLDESDQWDYVRTVIGKRVDNPQFVFYMESQRELSWTASRARGLQG